VHGWVVMPAMRDSEIVRVPLKRRLAQVLRRVPWLVSVARVPFRLTQAHFSVGVVGVILNDAGRILLVEHVYHPSQPWGLPGGWLAPGENPADGLRREVQEETGLHADILEPLLVEAQCRGHLDIAYLCRSEDDVVSLSGELLGYRWVSLDVVPPLLPFHRAAILAALARQGVLENRF
jgi:ADP-ribose pyrophosphatase YjhB (NUDIX family)